MQQNISEKTTQFINENFPDVNEVTPKELAISFGVTPRTIYNYIQAGKIPAEYRFGYKISVHGIAEFMDKTSDF